VPYEDGGAVVPAVPAYPAPGAGVPDTEGLAGVAATADDVLADDDLNGFHSEKLGDDQLPLWQPDSTTTATATTTHRARGLRMV
jgi:hypothetical protein